MATEAEAVPKAEEDDRDIFVPPSSRGRSRKKTSAGCLLVLGLASFLAVLLCGGLGIGAYLFLRPYFDDSVAETTEKDGGTEKSAGARETEFVDAGKSVRLGDVRVSVSSPAIDFVTGTEGNANFRSADKLFAIKVRLENVSDTRKVDYSGWGADANGDDLPHLTDDQGNAYKLVTFGGERRVAGQVRSEAIGPKKTVNDLIVFDAPAAGIQTLKLELSGATSAEREGSASRCRAR